MKKKDFTVGVLHHAAELGAAAALDVAFRAGLDRAAVTVCVIQAVVVVFAVVLQVCWIEESETK